MLSLGVLPMPFAPSREYKAAALAANGALTRVHTISDVALDHIK